MFYQASLENTLSFWFLNSLLFFFLVYLENHNFLMHCVLYCTVTYCTVDCTVLYFTVRYNLGNILAGATVQAKHPEKGTFLDAVINKIQV